MFDTDTLTDDFRYLAEKRIKEIDFLDHVFDNVEPLDDDDADALKALGDSIAVGPRAYAVDDVNAAWQYYQDCRQ